MGISTVPSTGARSSVSLGEETVYGIPVQPTHRIEFTSESVAATENQLISAALRPDRGRGKVSRGSLDIGGDLNYEMTTSGLGVLLKQALGDYLRVPNADGGFHARQARAAAVVLTAVGAGEFNASESIVLTDDTIAQFSTGKLAVVYKDASYQLNLDDNAGAGYDFDGFNTRVVSHVTAVTDPDTSHSGGVTGAVAITLAPVLGPDGALVNPVLNPNGGVLQYGPDRIETTYFESQDLGAGLGTKVWLNPADTPSLDPNVPVVGQAVIVLPCFTFVGAVPAGLDLGIGFWLYEIEAVASEYDGVFTHHIERGRALPIGMTVEVDRDAAVFVYAGMKVNTLTVNFEQNAIVTGTASLLGRNEYGITRLMADVAPGAASVIIEDGTAFAASGVITIGEETGMTYSAKTLNPDGTTTLTMVDTNTANPTAIQRLHLAGENVDPRTTTAVASPVLGQNSPLTVFESVAYIDGYYEEVLSGSITLNNNLNPDKMMLGDRGRAQLVEQRAEVEANLSLEFDDGKNYIKFLKGIRFALEVRCVSEEEDSEIANTGVLSQAYFLLPQCRYTGTTPNAADDSYIVHDMPIIAEPNDEFNTTDFIIILVNGSEYDCIAP